MKILTIGGAMQDIFIQHEKPEIIELKTDGKRCSFIILQEGKKIEVEKLVHSTGGGAINAAIGLKRLGFSVESFFKIGIDQAGDFIMQSLKKEGIAIPDIVRTDKAMTGTSFIIPSPSGNRAILVYRGANLLLIQQELPIKAIAQCDQLYITSLSGRASEVLPAIVKIAQEQKKSVATNPGTSQLTANVKTLIESLPAIDILILNCYEATLLMNSLQEKNTQRTVTRKQNNALPELLCEPITPPICFTLQEYCKQVLAYGPRIVVVTNGAEGVYVTDGTTIYFHPSLDIPVVSTLGAGDAFGSAFVACIAQGKSIEDALRAGILNASSVIQYLDAKTGLLSAKELEKRLQKIDNNLLQTFLL